MGRKKTHEEFVKEVYDLVGDEYEVVSEYVGSKINIDLKHNVCGTIYSKKPNSFLNGYRCPACRGYIVNDSNSLGSIRPDLAKEWHPTLNGNLTPHDVTYNKYLKVWWLGKDCGHSWESFISSRNKGSGCTICIGQDVLVGYNDMWTTNPELASLLADPEDGHKYMQWSGNKVFWKCKDCNHVLKKKKVIADVNKHGIRCPMCSDGLLFPEKFMYRILSDNDIEFEPQKTFDGASFRYDFYIPSINMIIETHGGNHYNGKFKTVGGRTKEEEKENDEAKMKFAKSIGVESYVVVDIRSSDFDYALESLKLSGLIEKLNLTINPEKLQKSIAHSLVYELSEMFEKYKSIKKVAEVSRLSMDTVRVYLRKGNEIGICSYTSMRHVHVCKLDENGAVLESYKSAKEAALANGLKEGSSITQCCQGKKKTAAGFKWMYKEDYEKMITGQQKEIS